MDNALSGSSALFSKPGAKTNAAISLLIPAAIIGAALWFFGGPIGDFIVGALENIWHMIFLGGGLVVLGGLFLDPKKRFFYLYRSVTRALTSMFIDIDPIGILKTYKERMESKLKEMNDSLIALKGQRVKTKNHQDQNLKDLENEYKLMEQAKIVNDQTQLTVHGKQATRLEARKQRYEGEMNRLNLLVGIMDRYYKLCDSTILDMGNEIKYREEEMAEAKASRKAVGAATAILRGLPEKEMWDEATLKLENDYSNAIGEVENFLDVTKNILAKSDLQDGADASKAMDLLDAWTKKNQNVSLGGQGAQVSKASIIQDAAQSMVGQQAPTGKPVYVVQSANTGGDDYLSMASKK